MNAQKRVTIVCPVYQEVANVSAVIESMLSQDYDQNLLEILVVDGMSVDGTRDVVSTYAASYSAVRMLDNPNRTAPYAMNIGILAAKGDVIVRIDCHSLYPRNYVATLVNHLFSLDAQNVGVGLITKPANGSIEACVVAEVCSSGFGVGNARFRTGVNSICRVDTVPFGCFRRDLFERIGYFDEELTRNQDDELNGRIIKNGGKIFLLPDLKIEYFARPTLAKMGKMFYQYGLFKPLVNKKLGRPATLRQLLPPLFVLGLVVGAVLSCLSSVVLWIYIGVLTLYVLIAIAQAVRYAARTQRVKAALLLPYGFIVAHVSYGSGYWRGIVKLLLQRPFTVGITR